STGLFPIFPHPSCSVGPKTGHSTPDQVEFFLWVPELNWWEVVILSYRYTTSFTQRSSKHSANCTGRIPSLILIWGDKAVARNVNSQSLLHHRRREDILASGTRANPCHTESIIRSLVPVHPRFVTLRIICCSSIQFLSPACPLPELENLLLLQAWALQ
uniref:Uncharacterized protein n=1 Tax=Gopherus evgoodei TaxID=1825980 RepID=A0A8C4VBT0_9SAUR